MSIARHAGTALLAQVAAATALFALLPLRLVLPERIVDVLALLEGGLAAGLAARWAGDLIPHAGGTAPERPRVTAAVTAGVAAALLTAALAGAHAPGIVTPRPPALAALTWSVPIALAATAAAGRFRSARVDPRRDYRLTLALLALALAAVPATLALAAAAGVAGA